MSLLERLQRVTETRETRADAGDGRDGTGAGAAATVLTRPPAVAAPPAEREEVLLAEGEAESFYQLKHMLMDAVLGSVTPELAAEPNEAMLRVKLDDVVTSVIESQGVKVSRDMRMQLVNDFVDEVVGLGPLEAYLDDPTVTKITVNAFDDIMVERLGKLEPTDRRFRDQDHLMAAIQKVASLLDGRIDEKVPLLDRKLPDDSRVRAKVPPIASTGPTITIEKKAGNPFDLLKSQQTQRDQAATRPLIELKERIQERLVQELDQSLVTGGQTDRLREQIEQMVNAAVEESQQALSRAERSELTGDLLHEIIGLGPIQPLLNDPEVSEVMVNGPNQVYCERHGKLVLTDKRFRDNNHCMQIIERIVAPLGRRVDEKSPMVDARLSDGSRVNAIIPPLALRGPTITIRKFSKDPFTMTDLVNFGTLTNEAAQFLKACVESRLNIVVSGGTGSGKTTTLNVLSSFIPSDERIVTIEDAAELQLRQDHVVPLESRPANIEGVGAIHIRDLVRNALRMRPDRIVVGECRGGEALDMLQAMNTGHDGSLTTGHANSPREMLSRLEVMVLMAGMELPVRAIREQIAGAVDLILQVSRLRDGSRKVTYITEVVGMETDVITMQDLFVFEQEGVDDRGKIIGSLRPTGLRPKAMERIAEAGIKLPMNIFKT